MRLGENKTTSKTKLNGKLFFETFCLNNNNVISAYIALYIVRLLYVSSRVNQ